MAYVKICTTGGGCITCGGKSSVLVVAELTKLEAKGEKYYCCQSRCVRLDQITTVVDLGKEEPPETDDGDHWDSRGDITIVKPQSMVIHY